MNTLQVQCYPTWPSSHLGNLCAINYLCPRSTYTLRSRHVSSETNSSICPTGHNSSSHTHLFQACDCNYFYPPASHNLKTWPLYSTATRYGAPDLTRRPSQSKVTVLQSSLTLNLTNLRTVPDTNL